jgi:hypothetical protein
MVDTSISLFVLELELTTIPDGTIEGGKLLFSIGGT